MNAALTELDHIAAALTTLATAIDNTITQEAKQHATHMAAIRGEEET